MMLSVPIPDTAVSFSLPHPYAYVEKVEYVPDLQAWQSLEQRKTKYNFWYDSNATSVVKIKQAHSSDDYNDIESHIKSYLDTAYFVDTSVAKLISENLDDLF